LTNLGATSILWGQPVNNDFLLVSQFSVTGALHTCRPHLVGFVNGLPLVVIELTKLGVPARAAFDENLTHYTAEIPQLFWFNALLIASNSTDSRVGSLTADWEVLAHGHLLRGSFRRAPSASSARTSRARCRWR
jgi:type I site-specific restriction-modification system R (restriction) subunit